MVKTARAMLVLLFIALFDSMTRRIECLSEKLEYIFCL